MEIMCCINKEAPQMELDSLDIATTLEQITQEYENV